MNGVATRPGSDAPSESGAHGIVSPTQPGAHEPASTKHGGDVACASEALHDDLELGRRRRGWRRIVRIGSGIAFLVLGVAGLFLPVLQGVLFLAIGCALLAPDVPIARRLFLGLLRRSRRLRRLVPRRFRRLARKDRDR